MNALWFLIGCLMGGGMVLLGGAMQRAFYHEDKRNVR